MRAWFLVAVALTGCYRTQTPADGDAARDAVRSVDVPDAMSLPDVSFVDRSDGIDAADVEGGLDAANLGSDVADEAVEDAAADADAAPDPVQLATQACMDATPLPPNGMLAGTSRDDGLVVDPSASALRACLGGEAPEVWKFFSLRVPPHQRAHVEAEINECSSTQRAYLRVFAGCHFASCLTSGLVENPRDEALDVIVAVSGCGFTVSDTLEPLTPSPSPTCGSATGRALDPAGETAAGFLLDDSDPARIYPVHLEQRTVLHFDTRNGVIPWPPPVCITRRCQSEPIVCNDVRPYFNDSEHRHLQLLDAGDYDLRVGPDHVGPEPFAYQFSISSEAPPAAADCATAPAFTQFTGDILTDRGALPPDQQNLMGVRQQFFPFVIPPGKIAILRGIAVDDGSSQMRVLDHCGGMTLATERVSHSNNDGDPEAQVRLGNPVGVDRSLILAAEEVDGSHDSEMHVLLSLFDPLPNALCENAVPVTTGGGGDLRAAMPDANFDAAQVPGALFFSATIPALQTLHVGLWGANCDAQLQILTSCGGTALASFRGNNCDGLVGGGTYTNSGSTDLPIVLRLSAPSIEHAFPASFTLSTAP